MKMGYLTKSANAASSKELALINQYTRKELTAEEVYTFSAVMCDNNIDRDGDKFTVKALKELSDLFIGKTVIFDHMAKAENQCARIYKTSVEISATEKNTTGEPLAQLTCDAYMLNNSANSEIIESIDGGILKEVSVGFSLGKAICSICGNDYRSKKCLHMRGRKYKTDDGKETTCYVILDEINDAYEMSLVAVPAQRNAGIKKWYDDSKKLSENNKLKGENEKMNYEEAKKALAEIGVDIALISKSAGEMPPLEEILKAVKKRFDESCTATLENTSNNNSVCIDKSAVETAAGKSLNADDVLSIIKNSRSSKEKADAYDALKKSAQEKAITNGIKAKGESFDSDRWNKNFEGYSIEEIEKQSQEWENEAKKALKADGRHSEDSFKSRESLSINNVEPYCVFGKI